MTLSVLVVGGAGYIGSHMVKMLAERGIETTVFDNLSQGHRDAVIAGDFIQGDLLNKDNIDSVFKKHFDAVIHFAALCYVGESVYRPLDYYRNNVIGTINLLDAMRNAGVGNMVFSSSCATYGIPSAIPISENNAQRPINPYGETKLFVENSLKDCAHAYNLKSISLRYFNAAGCDPEGVLGERHNPETHLLPLVLHEALRILSGGRSEETRLYVYGDDFGTPDGTCIRDYIHVQDLCSAHLLAIDRLFEGSVAGAEAFNLGNGTGFSVKEVIGAARRVSGVDIRYRVTDRREGDPPCLVASAEKARQVLGWKPAITDLEQIVETAWNWVKKSNISCGGAVS